MLSSLDNVLVAMILATTLHLTDKGDGPSAELAADPSPTHIFILHFPFPPAASFALSLSVVRGGAPVLVFFPTRLTKQGY